MRRRRVIAAGVVLPVVALAVVVACAVPFQRPAAVPESSAATLLGAAPQPSPQPIIVARLEGLDLLLPVEPSAATAVAFHPVEYENALPLSPVEEDASQAADGTPLRCYLMDGSGECRSSPTAGLDVGSVPGSPILSPVDGQVSAVREYTLLGRHRDCEIDIAVAADPTLRVVMTHVASPRVHVGDQVRAGFSVLGEVRGFPAAVHQDISRFTNDAGDHVQVLVLRVTPNLAGL